MTTVTKNRRTVESYERIARDYTDSTEPGPDAEAGPGLRRMVELTPAGGSVLEIGSGPGWDADLAEGLGVTVRRTDVTDAFLDLQRERGKQVERLDVLADDLGGPYDAVMAVAVLQHIERPLIAGVLAKAADALRPDGVFLVMVREGTGEFWEGKYHTVLWDRDGFTAALATAGLRPDWVEQKEYDRGPWLTIVARRASEGGLAERR